MSATYTCPNGHKFVAPTGTADRRCPACEPRADDVTLATLKAWLTRPDSGPYSVRARIQLGGWAHTGYLSFQGDRIYVRDSKRKANMQYLTVTERHLREGRLEISTGRFHPAHEVVTRHKAEAL